MNSIKKPKRNFRSIPNPTLLSVSCLSTMIAPKGRKRKHSPAPLGRGKFDTNDNYIVLKVIGVDSCLMLG